MYSLIAIMSNQNNTNQQNVCISVHLQKTHQIQFDDYESSQYIQ